MSDSTYDVLIVGAGAAGCAAAMNLPRGVRALLVDRGQPSDGRCCGGLLAPDAQRGITRLGLTLPQDVRVRPEPQAVHVHDLDSGRDQVYRRDYLNLDRRRFDAWLLGLAAARARFRPHTRLVGLDIQDEGVAARIASAGIEENVQARLLVGADGAASAVRRAAMQAGLQPITERTCMKCHKNAHGRTFDCAAAMKMIATTTPATMICQRCWQNKAKPTMICVISGSSSPKSCRNSLNFGMMKKIINDTRPIDRVNRIAG